MAGSLLETTLNTRDLGGHAAAGGRVTRRDVLLRSDRQACPSPRDVQYLLDRDIRTIVDLRTEQDAAQFPCGLRDLPGFAYQNLPIAEGSGVPETVQDVAPSYLRIARATSMPGVFRAMAAAPGGVLFSCTAGKDRTGVVSAILLLLCGVSDEEIIADYMETKTCSQPLFEQLAKTHPELDLRIVIPRPAYMRDFLALFRAAYTDAEGYLTALGLSPAGRDALRRKLLP